MNRHYEQRLSRLARGDDGKLIQGGMAGLEKESLRVAPDGGLAQTDHPRALGAALTNPHITTDYSEALLELITPPFTDVSETLRCLRDVHQFVYSKLGDEFLWATSMPCVVRGEESIRVAEYGSSNIARMKTTYRVGLGYRYGRMMQVISGVHFNYSLPETFWPVFQDHEGDPRTPQDFISESYLGMIRNLQRHGWLVAYLFGASPAVCKSFLVGRPTDMQEFDANSYYEPWATSLRMGDIGYRNTREDEFGVKACYDTLDKYIGCLTRAIETPWPEYEQIGVLVDGEYRQLNANILQIENEYYSSVRPKQISGRYEKPTLALERRGVRYVELRSPDVNAYEPLGVSEVQIRFLEAFMVYCLLADSPLIDSDEGRCIDHNHSVVSTRGREPGLQLRNPGAARPLQNWAMDICESMSGVCELLDAGKTGTPYMNSLAAQKEAINDPDRTPSARMLAEMRANNEGFYHFARRMSLQHRQRLLEEPLDAARFSAMEAAAEKSLRDQAEIEAADDGKPFSEFLADYFSESLPSTYA